MTSTRMQLIGGEQVLAADGEMEAMIRFYGELFDRLPKEARNTGDPARFVCYQSPLGGGDFSHFLGVEVNGIERIPTGMVAWDLGDSEWIAWEAKAGRDEIVSREPIAWRWRDRSPGGRLLGEFAGPGGREYWLSSNSYFGRNETEASDDAIYLVDYDPEWPVRFAEMARWLRESLGPEVALRVEHYGSTAIPGIPAKPVIDLLVEVSSFPEAKRKVLPLLNREDWEYWWYSGHMVCFKRKKLMGERTHHLHFAPAGHPIWRGLAFRDYLRNHPEEAARYADLKRDLAAVHRNSREGYTQAKTAFVMEVTERALKDPARPPLPFPG